MQAHESGSTPAGSAWSSGAVYALEGVVLRAGGVVQPANDACVVASGDRSVAAWRIRSGRIRDVDVSGQVVLTVSLLSAVGCAGLRVILLDEEATPEQVLALLDAFQGRLGGPLADLAGSSGEEAGYSQVPIECRIGTGGGAVSVPDRLKLVVRCAVPREPGRRLDRTGDECTSEVSVALSEHGLTWHDRKAQAVYRDFRVSDGPCSRSP
jgi:hypothetical protein